jgi:protein TonB
MSKLSIFDSAWTDMVFEGRNKDYGAYQLRKENPRTTIIALLSAFALLGVALAIPSIASYFSPAKFSATVYKPDTTIHVTEYVSPPKKTEAPQAPKHNTAPPVTQPVTPQNSLAHARLTERPTTAEPVNPQTAPVIDVPAVPAGGGGTATTGPATTGPETTPGPDVSNAPVLAAAVDVQPGFPGGMDKFYKYVAKNFKAPEDERVAGNTMKVIVYFVIEKDGSMTDIKVLRNPGYGMDKEAVRVLKSLSIRWTPGKIKNQEVRTAYTLPITVQAQ